MTIVRTSLRNFFAHKGRMLLSGMAVVLSVAFVCGTLVFTATMTATFDRLFSETASNVMIGPDTGDDGMMDEGPTTGRPDTIPASVVEEIEGVGGVELATGTIASLNVVLVDADNENIGPTTGAPTMGLSWSPLEERSTKIIEGQEPSGPGEMVIDADTAKKQNIELGDELRALTISGDHTVTVSGVAEFLTTNPGAALVYFDEATAQDFLLEGQDAYTEIYVDSTGELTDEALRDAVAATLEDSGALKILTAEEYTEENQDALGEFMDIIRYVLLGFAGIALLVGVFLIVNTFSMLVAQRTREIGLMRAIGSSRKQVNRSVLIEALLLGVFGSVIGFGVGIGLAVGLMKLMSAMGLELSTDDLTVGWAVPVTGIVLGIVVTVLAAYIPARRAGKITPMAALRDAGTPGDARAGRVRAIIGAVLTVGGGAALLGTTATDETGAAAGYLSIGILFSLVGLVLVAPSLVGLVVRGLSAVLLRGFGPIGRLAERNALRNPRRTGGTASALMIGLALVTSLSVVGSSMVASATDEIDNSLGADYIIQTSNWMPILPGPVEAVKSADHLDHVTEYRMIDSEITLPGGKQLERGLSAAQSTYVDDLTVDVAEGDIAEVYERRGIAIDAGSADEHGVSIGDELTVEFAGGESASLPVLAITTGESTLEGTTWYISQDTAEEHIAEEAMPLPFMLFVSAQPDHQDEARASLDEVLQAHPQMEVRDQAEYKEMIQGQVGMLLNMVYGLLALAIIVAVLGVVNTLALSVVERTREIGLMRAIGLSRRQLRRMIRLESVVIALFGALLGLGIGMAWGMAGQRLMAMEGMKILDIPWPTIIAVVLGAAFVGLLAALVPAFRAGRMNVLNAIATE